MPGGWRGFEQAVGDHGECEELEVVNPNDWEPLTLLCAPATGRYIARDADGMRIVEAESFAALLHALDITLS